MDADKRSKEKGKSDEEADKRRVNMRVDWNINRNEPG